MARRRIIKAVDLFAGVGGSSAGARAAGVRVVAAIDTWELAKTTYKSNFPEVKFLWSKCEDVDLVKLKKQLGRVDLILASPECTSHTCAKGSAPRSEESRGTAFEVLRFAAILLPRWIVIENVVHMRKWDRYKGWLKKIQSMGYKVRTQVINSADHGVPQSRRRLFILCDRQATPPKVEPTSAVPRTVKSVIFPNGTFPFTPLNSPNRATATLERAARAMKRLGETEPFLLVYYGSDAAGGWQTIDRPLRTLTTVDRFGYVRPCQGGHEMRMLQVPEIKAAMGFPEKHRFDHGSRREKIKLLGNAVCPPVMKAAIESLTQKI